MQGYLNLKKLITMKRLFLLLVAGLLASAATMQVGAQAPQRKGWDGFPLYGNVKKVCATGWGETVYTFNERGDVDAIQQTANEEDGQSFPSRYFTYDAQGRITNEEEICYYYMNDIKYIYNDAGQLIEKRVYSKLENALSDIYTYKYDAKGNVIQCKCAGADGSVWDSYTYTYKLDDNNRVIEKVTYNTDGSVGSKETYKYDANGNLLESAEYDGGNRVLRKLIYRYDAEGKPIKVVEYDGNEDAYNTLTLDSHGNVIKHDYTTYKIEYR